MIMCLSEVTCISVDCCFVELALKKSNSMGWFLKNRYNHFIKRSEWCMMHI